MGGRAWIFAIAMAACVGCVASGTKPPTVSALPLNSLPRVAEVDPRFQSFNVEMAQVTGGRFWAPYGGPPDVVYSQQPPTDLYNARLRNLTRELAPAYVRVSGTWANSSYLLGPGEPTPAAAPAGYLQVLTRDQWRGVVDFARATDLKIITSFAASIGARGSDGVWRSDQAKRLVDLTREAGGAIAAAEFFNEPNLVGVANSALPPDYSADDYRRDFAVFSAFAKKEIPDAAILGPGGGVLVGAPRTTLAKTLDNAALVSGSASTLDALSYHFYGALSQRCAAQGLQTSADEALTPRWLARATDAFASFSALRDRLAPGKPIWLTETGQAACGGSPWASSFLDTFRYLDQMGQLAQRGVKVVAHNTLSRSDYALINGETLEPRPSYWAAVLWRRLMGTVVLESPPSPSASLRLYAHCLRDAQGGVALLALNLGEVEENLPLRGGAKLYLLTAPDLQARHIFLNGTQVTALPDGRAPKLLAARTSGAIDLPAHSVAFISVEAASNPACRY